MTRRIFVFVLAAMMLLLGVMPVHAAQPVPAFVVDTVTAQAGETVDVTVRLENNPGVTSIKLELEYDEALTLTGVACNSALGDKFLCSPEGKYPVLLNWYDGLKDVTGDWVFVTLTFAVAEDAAAGRYSVRISYNANDVFDANEDNVHFDIQNGAVEVKEAQAHTHSYTGGVCSSCGHSVLGTDWLAPDFAQGDYVVAVLPDTQNTVELAPDTYYQLTQWIADNRDPMNIQAVIHLGDMVNQNTGEQWQTAKKGMDQIHASGVAWMPMRGNHDDSAMFNSYFDYSTYGSSRSWFGGSYEEGKLDHTYWFFTVGDRTYLVLSLGWAPSWDVLDWAEAIVRENSDKNVILSCHAYVDSDGYPLEYGDAGSITSYPGLEDYPEGSDIWDTFGKFDNVVLAMSGHVSSNDLVVYKGLNGQGKPVASILADAQTMDLAYPLGMVMLLSFHEDTDTVDVNWYSTAYDALYQEENQFSVHVPHVHNHRYIQQIVEPTCQEPGYILHSCSCGNSYKTDFTDALDHTVVIDPAVKATCTQTGLTEGSHCAFCGEILVSQTVIPAKGHSYTHKVTAPTCTEKGYTTHTCACGESYVDSYVDATGHTMGSWQVTKAPGCTETGTEQRDCANCDHCETREVAAKGHSYTHKVTAPTCTEKGYTTHTCACGESYVDSYVDATGHTMGSWQVTKAPGCTETGTEQRDCANCDHIETREVAAKGHSYTHKVTAPTCTEKGYTTHTCICGDSYVGSYVDATGHKMGTWYETKAPTCTTKGSEQRDCANCDYFEYREVAAKGHSYTYKVTAPTCTEKGYTTHTCACGDSYMDSYVEATGHKMGSWYETKAPTCTTKGTEQRDCANCDHYETRETEAKGHSYTHKVTAPTCTEKGYTTHICACGDSYMDSYVEATGHKMGSWYETKAPTCTTKGTEQRDCTNCDHYETRGTEAKGHSYTHKVTAPSCTENGFTTHTCHCGDSYVDSYVAALGHAYGDWYQTKAPTLEAEGEERRDCSRCDDFQTRKIPMLVHNYTSDVTAPTCTEQGYTTHTCTNCGDVYVDTYVAALGHSFTKYVSNSDATCITDGTKTAKCDRCDAIDTVTDVGSRTGHSLGNWYETKAPTCTAKGTEQRHCANCDHIETRETEAKGHSYTHKITAPTCTEQGYTTHTCACGESYVDSYVEATGHKMGSWQVTKAPTCTETGTEQRECANCDHVETRETEAKGHSYAEAVTAPTCTEKGYTTHTCSCGESYVDSYVNETGHSWDDGLVTLEPTEQNEGIRTYTCGSCGETDTQSIPKLDHTHIFSSEVTNPTCTEAGYTTFRCSCGESYVTQKKDPLGHSWDQWEVTREPNYQNFGERSHVCERCGVVETEEINNNPFPDVGNGNSFKNYILWGYYEGIVSGDKQGYFNADKTVTRGQFIIMLWRAAGKPEPTQFNAFPDVNENSTFYKAVCWAVEQGITNGKKDGNFGVNDPCTRGHVVLFLHRFAGSPASEGNISFPDVTGGTYYNAVCWAAENGITSGQKDGTFGVSLPCKRMHTMKFLYVYMSLVQTQKELKN